MKKRLFGIITVFLLVFALTGCEFGSGTGTPVPTPSPTPTPTPTVGNQKLESKKVSSYAMMEEEACFNFFWETQVTDETLYSYGLIPDRYPSNGLASIASVGFGLAAIPIGIQNDWITYEEGEERVIKTLLSLDELKTIHGFYYHFYSMDSGRPSYGSEVSDIDTALFVAGALMAGEYFQGEAKELAEKIYAEVEWPWFVDPKNNQFYMSYDPVAQKFKDGHWDFYGEQLVMYFLGAGSPTYPIEKKVYDSFNRHLGFYGGQGFYHSWFGSIFTYQFSHAFVDFRNIVDASGINWYENSVKATIAARQYCIDNPEGFLAFHEDSWGLTACDTPTGYSGLLGNAPSGYSNDAHKNDGTVALAGSIGSFPFLPNEVESSIEYYYTLLDGKLVGKYGLYDSYNLEKNRKWVANDVIGIDKGISLLMIENYRSGLVWEYFMQSEYIQTAISVLGFEVKEAE